MAGVAIAVVALFLGGGVIAVIAVIAVVALGVRREDRRYTMASEGPSVLARSERRVTGFGRRDLDAEFPPQAEQAREDAERAGRSGGDPGVDR